MVTQVAAVERMRNGWIKLTVFADERNVPTATLGLSLVPGQGRLLPSAAHCWQWSHLNSQPLSTQASPAPWTPCQPQASHPACTPKRQGMP